MNVKEQKPREVVIRKDFASKVSGKRGYFHKWCEAPIYDGGVYLAKTLGLIEFEDGTVMMIEPELIKFQK